VEGGRRRVEGKTKPLRPPPSIPDILHYARDLPPLRLRLKLRISLKHGRGNVKAVDAKTKTYELGRKFMEEFSSKNGSCICGELLGVDISTPEGLQEANDAKLFTTRCLDMVKSACEILEKTL